MLTGSRVKNDAVSGCSSLLLQGTEDRRGQKREKRKVAVSRAGVLIVSF